MNEESLWKLGIYQCISDKYIVARHREFNPIQSIENSLFKGYTWLKLSSAWLFAIKLWLILIKRET